MCVQVNYAHAMKTTIIWTATLAALRDQPYLYSIKRSCPESVS